MQQKTMRVKSWDPATQKFKYDKVAIGGYRFTDDDRMKICSEFLESGEPASVFVEKYHLNSKEVLYGWVKKFLNGKDEMRAKPPAWAIKVILEDELIGR